MLETITPIDFSILNIIQDCLACPFADTFFTTVTQLGDGGFIWIVITFALMCTKRFRKIGIAAFIALALVASIGEIAIKMVVCRPRPFIQDPSIALLIAPPQGYSFPSIHSASSIAVALVLCAIPSVYKREGTTTPITVKIGITVSIVLALLIAFSRLYVQVHFPSDVLVGLLFGIVCGLIALWITNYLYKKYEKRTSL